MKEKRNKKRLLNEESNSSATKRAKTARIEKKFQNLYI